MSEDFDIFNADLDSVQVMPEFSAVKPGAYGLKADDIKVERDDENRVLASIRHSITSDGVEKIVPGAVAGSIFNRLYFHTNKTLPFIKAFVEGHGGVWSDFTSALRAGKGRDLVEVLTELFAPYIGTSSQAKVGVEVYNSKPKNVIDRYLTVKAAA